MVFLEAYRASFLAQYFLLSHEQNSFRTKWI